MADPRNILVFLPNWVGDVVMATPALWALRGHFPAARITYLGRKIALGVLAGTDWADATIVDASSQPPAMLNFAKTALAIRHAGFDLAVLLPNSFRSAALVRVGGGVSDVVGYDRDGRGLMLSRKLQPARGKGGRFVPVPQIDYYNALVAQLGAGDIGWRMELPVEPADEQAAGELLQAAAAAAHWPLDGCRPLVMLNPGASFGPSKLWPAARFAAAADALADRFGAGILINAAPAEKPIAAAVAAAMKHRPLVNFADRDNTLGLLKALLKRCDLLVTNDTGARHFGAALGCDLVTIFGSTDPTWAHIDYERERMIRVAVPCSPCQSKTCRQPEGETFHQCMAAVTVDSVVSAAAELLSGRQAFRGGCA